MKILSKIKLGSKMHIGFAVITFIMIIVLLFGYFGLKNSNDLFYDYSLISKKIDYISRVQSNMLSARISFKTLLEKDRLDEAKIYMEDYSNTYGEMKQYLNLFFLIEKDAHRLYLASEIGNYATEYNTEFRKIVSNIGDNTISESKFLDLKKNKVQVADSMNKMDEIGPKMSTLIEDIKLALLEEQPKTETQVKDNLKRTTLLMIFLAIIGAVLSSVISFKTTSFIINPIKTLSSTFEKFSEGNDDLSVRLDVNTEDEIGSMSTYFNMFMNKLSDMVIDLNKHNLIKTKQNEINNIIRLEQSLDEMATNIVGFVCELTDSFIGAIYVKNEDEIFHLQSSYAQCSMQQFFLNDVNTTQGLIGQCARDKKMIIVEDVPDDYIKINSGLGDAKPNNIILVPCLYAEETIGVIELGLFSSLTNVQLDLLSVVSDTIAVGVFSTLSKNKTKLLYEKTLQQTEELQVQQEELMQSHEELQEQTNSLVEKENMLQVQQEELRVTNVELEEKNKELERQKNDIINKNDILEKTKIDLEEKARDLESANKYKSEFLANVSHELRTPLNSILVLSQLLLSRSDSSLTPKEQEYAKTINSSGAELLTLISDILDLAKVEAGKIEVVVDKIYLDDLKQYFEGVFSEIAKNKNLEFEIALEQGLPEYIMSDELRVKQIIKNFLSNSFKFTEEGKVVLDITRPNKDVLDKKNMDINSIAFSVKDTGIGISKEKIDIVFEAFKQADGTINRKYGGTGLGLSISNQLAKLLKGIIFVESEIGKGSSFSLILPREFNPNDTTHTEVQIAEKTQKNTAIVTKQNEVIKPEGIVKDVSDEKEDTLLIIEDDEVFANILKDLASEKSMACVLANSGEKGLEIARRTNPTAIILDIGLPDMNGMDVVAQLQSDDKTKDIPIHIISGYEDENIKNKNSVMGYLKKPVSLKQMDKVFGEIEKISTKQFKKMLIVGIKDEIIDNFVKQRKEASWKAVMSGEKAYALLEKDSFDCIILEKDLEDMPSHQFLVMLEEKGKNNIPIIIYTEKEITNKEEEKLSKYTDSIIIRGPRSLERLVAETDIFLYRINEDSNKKHNKTKPIKLAGDNEFEGKKILLIDDDVRNIFSITGLLETRGIKVEVGRNGKEGLEKYSKNEDIDLVLMDIMMPVMDGYEAISEIRKMPKGKDVPIIALTAKSMSEDKNKCLEVGANDYMSKPIDSDKLISLLRVWLSK